MEDYLTCNVCVELFDNKEHLPLILSCGHTLCRCCISSIHQAQGFIMCPIDRSPESKPIESLITNLALLQLVDVSRFTDYPRCPLHPSKKLRYYCHTPCAKAFCSKCTLAHSSHSCFDPEDAKSFEALLAYIESKSLQLTAETDYSQGLVAQYEAQLAELGERQSQLVHEVTLKFRALHTALNGREFTALEEIENTTAQLKGSIEGEHTGAREQAVATANTLQEVMMIREALRSSLPQERLAYTAKLHKLVSSRPVSLQVPQDYVKRLPAKLKSACTPTKETPRKASVRHAMQMEAEIDECRLGLKRARLDESSCYADEV
jgi:hypothetical protein